ncbi:hypothetical protein [Maribacter sp. ACAM166]|uniref:hypothetical protein n=1 Tax=Maribacter sp. ACAM166 TaxID=2508996 RepID=UPI0010FF0A3F|nr:hypothetical protein [Maribacter sp. ACAM166]TLP81356.1 hypothetical protein ES765_04940 [Maribacter sp. ACAM166]
MADTKHTTFKEITKDQISNWKKTKTGLRQIEVPVDGGEPAKFIICKPTRNLLPSITQYGKDENIEALNRLLVTNCVLGGDMLYMDDDSGDMAVYLAVLAEVGKLMQAKGVISKII